ncbi:hypothetical protein EM864_03770 [Stenotrophomonas acidaminiphila]|nr:hypothetical protein [Stenotrophomonas acidaminiphila]
MNTATHRPYRVMVLVVMAVLGGAMPQAAGPAPAVATAATAAPAATAPAAGPLPAGARPPPRCLKRSALGKCERRVPSTVRHPPPATPAQRTERQPQA